MMKNLMIKNIKYNQCMKNYCTMHVGGNAKYFVEVDSLCELKNTVKECNKKSIKYFILGNGSNVIFTDKGYNGCVISTKKLNKITVKNNIVCAECGVNLFRLNQELIEHGLSGIEWSYGIPGTIGGAVCMNAGAYGGEMKDVVLKVKVFDGKTTKILYTNM